MSFSDEEVERVRKWPKTVSNMNGDVTRMLARLDAAEVVCGILQRGADNKLMDTDDIARMDAALAAWRASCGEVTT